MIVGKGGKSIARIEKDSSARVQLLQQNEDNTSQERVVTVQGKFFQLRVTLKLVHFLADFSVLLL